MGYVLIPSDKRVLDNVLAFSNEGKVSFEDGNPGKAIFVERLKNYQQAEIEKTMRLGDSLGAEAMEKITGGQMPQTRVRPAGTAFTIDVPDSHLYMENIAQVRPMLKTKWGQWAPYNANLQGGCDNYTGKVPAGCVPVAVGQIMVYHRWPARCGDVAYNWDALLGANPVELARFIAFLGSDKYNGHEKPGMTTDYNCGGSSTNYGNDFDFLNQNNYRYKGTYSYDYNTVCWSIDANCPLYARGDDGKNGHAWVIDGSVSLASKSKSCVLTACFNYEGYFIGYDGGPHSCVTKNFRMRTSTMCIAIGVGMALTTDIS